MDAELTNKLQELSPLIESAVRTHFPHPSVQGADPLHDCMQYATFSGGRRMRPVLCLLAADAAGLERPDALQLAAAVEYLHTASLIYDDLPAMDDAAQRRGMPPAHVRFGEGVALLAGLSLVTHAFHLLARWPALVRMAAESVGHLGMSAGQTIDLAGGLRDQPHYLKTTALFRVAVVSPAIAVAAGPDVQRALTQFADHLGTAYQLMDDADDEYADALRADARSHLARAQDAVQSFDPDGLLAGYAAHLVAPVMARE
jgi:geranylgeranyl diphosphate synthase type II